MADLRIKSIEEMVGSGHASKADTLNRLSLAEHGIDGSHRWFDVTSPTFGALGDGITDDTLAIQAACDAVPVTGGIRTVYFPSGTYIITGQLNLNKNNLTIRGEGDSSVVKVKDANGDLQVGGYGAIFAIASGVANLTIQDLQLDGNADNNSASTYSCINGWSTDNLTIRGMLIKNPPFCGILLSATTLPHSNFTISNNRVENIGWRGIQVQYGYIGSITENKVISTGGQGIALVTGSVIGANSCQGIVVSNNVVNRAVPPTTILVGQVEAEMMIIIDKGSTDILIDSNICYDNRNAGNDGIAIGANTVGEAMYQSIVISNNIVTLAGGFGIDATSNCVVIGNIILQPATHGIVIAGDMGPDRKDTIIANNIIQSSNYSNNPAVVAGIYIGSAVDNGQTWRRLRVINNTIVDEGLKTTYAVYLDANKVSLDNVEISGNHLEPVAVQSIYTSTAGGHLITNLRVHNNVEKSSWISLANIAAPSVLGGERFNSTGNVSITNFSDGYPGQEIWITFGAARTVNFAGNSNMFGNGQVDWVAGVGDQMKCVADSNGFWRCIVA